MFAIKSKFMDGTMFVGMQFPFLDQLTLLYQEGRCTVMSMCVFVMHVLYLQCRLGLRARAGRHVD